MKSRGKKTCALGISKESILDFSLLNLWLFTEEIGATCPEGSRDRGVMEKVNQDSIVLELNFTSQLLDTTVSKSQAQGWTSEKALVLLV